MQTCELVYVAALAVPLGAPVNAPKKVKFGATTDVPGCLQMFVDYTQGVAGRVLTITLVFGTANGDIYTIPASASTTIAATGKTVLALNITGAPRIVALNFSTAGGAGADDTVSIKFSGLPVTGVVIS